MQWWGPGPSQPRSLHSGSQGPGIAKLNDFMEFYLVVEASKRTEVLWNAATVATPVCVRIYHPPLYSSVNSSLVCAIISAERGFSLRRMYGCTEVPYRTSDHSFSLPAATRAV